MSRPCLSSLFSGLLFGALVLSLLAGCGESSQPSNEPLPDIPRAEILRKFALLDEYGRETPPKYAAFGGRNPTGALLNLPDQKGKRKTVCSQAHLASEFVITNAHCVGDDSTPAEDLFIYYYNKHTGLPNYARVKEKVFVGNPNYDDVALLRVPSVVASDYDSITTLEKLRHDGKAWGKERPATPHGAEKVVLYAYDPLIGIAPGGRGSLGMIAHAKRCLASRAVPQVAAADRSGNRKRIQEFSDSQKKMNAEAHIFLDDCSRSPRGGNSGAILMEESNSSDPSQPPRPLGTFQWVLEKGYFSGPKSQFQQYFGNRGEWLTFQWEEPRDAAFGVGTAFDYLLQQLGVNAFLK